MPGLRAMTDERRVLFLLAFALHLPPFVAIRPSHQATVVHQFPDATTIDSSWISLS